ncbi:hypothetical protein [Sphingobacterium yanglingense]|nr:hypothetical protein [Sphingobacterium yanglingense]
MDKIKGVAKQAGIILLGGIFVSAFWDFLAKDTLVRIGRWIVEFSSNFSNTLTDFTYKSPSSSHVIFNILPSLLMIMGIIGFVVIRSIEMLQRLREQKLKISNDNNKDEEEGIEEEDIEDKPAKKNRSKVVIGLIRVNIFLYLFVIPFYVAMLSMLIFQNSVKLVTERNMGILKPYVTNNRYDFLYSEYLQIKTKSDFVKLQTQLDSIADAHKIKISDPSK